MIIQVHICKQKYDNKGMTIIYYDNKKQTIIRLVLTSSVNIGRFTEDEYVDGCVFALLGTSNQFNHYLFI